MSNSPFHAPEPIVNSVLHSVTSRNCRYLPVYIPVTNYTACDRRSHVSLVQADLLHLTIRCLAVTGGGSIGECGRLSQTSWFLGAL